MDTPVCCRPKLLAVDRFRWGGRLTDWPTDHWSPWLRPWELLVVSWCVQWRTSTKSKATTAWRGSGLRRKISEEAKHISLLDRRHRLRRRRRHRHRHIRPCRRSDRPPQSSTCTQPLLTTRLHATVPQSKEIVPSRPACGVHPSIPHPPTHPRGPHTAPHLSIYERLSCPLPRECSFCINRFDRARTVWQRIRSGETIRHVLSPTDSTRWETEPNYSDCRIAVAWGQRRPEWPGCWCCTRVHRYRQQ